jgi:hypothetical protein
MCTVVVLLGRYVGHDPVIIAGQEVNAKEACNTCTLTD